MLAARLVGKEGRVVAFEPLRNGVSDHEKLVLYSVTRSVSEDWEKHC